MSILVAAYKKNFHEEINRSCSCHPSYDVYDKESEFQLLSAKTLESLVDDCIRFRVSDDFNDQDKCDLKIDYRECNFHILFGDSIDSLNQGDYDSIESILILDEATFYVYDLDIYHPELNTFLDLYKEKWAVWKQANLTKKQKHLQEVAQNKALEEQKKLEAEKLRKEAQFEALKKELGK